MSVEDTGPDTEPERGPAPDGRDKLFVLLIASFVDRRVALLPADGSLTIGRAGADPAAGEGSGDGRTLGLSDGLLSREHLRVSRTGRGYEIADLASRNGTFLDGRRLEQPTHLSDGCIILFGNQVAVFRQTSQAELAALDKESADPFGPVPTFSPALALTFARLRKLAKTEAELLLVGETGVGKEVVARAVHRLSGRRGKLIAINCAALPAAEVDGELFGYVAGAYAGASGKRGLVEAADGGTLLLDEIGELPPELQVKIFRFLQDRSFRPLGSTKVRRLDVRVMAATARLEGSGPGIPRPDLVARLGAEPISIPALRRRPEDVPSLLAHYAEGVREVEPAALRAMCLYGWPLNVRELEKSIGNALAMSHGGRLRLEHLPSQIRGALERGAPIEARRREPRVAPDRIELEQLLKQHGGNVASVARTLDRKWNVVWRWVVKHKLKPEKFKKTE
ncbi:MAG TPA: sigma 54-interacting transcriptional regulator [Polyangia bacterium]|nr:sigma 54-interacting transcriptional regulator [Polyangia bacterium]